MRTPVPFGMPLHAGCECLAVPDPHCFYDPVRGAGFNGQVVSEAVYALLMHAVYPHCSRRGQFPQFAVRFKYNVVGVGEALFDAPVFRREVVQLARQAGYVLVQGAPQGYVEFLYSPADTQHGDPRVDNFRDQRQGRCVPVRVLHGIFRRGFAPVAL